LFSSMSCFIKHTIWFTIETTANGSHSCDGVLFAGSKEIPAAKPALRAVRRHGIRYLFLTNGGGVHDEAHKAASLTKQVRLAAPEQMFTRRVIQSHTPMRNWPDDVKNNDTVYITSRNPTMARKVAEQ
jgi:ribonucleotide monophosphatase NagD (HAD superfamily)